MMRNTVICLIDGEMSYMSADMYVLAFYWQGLCICMRMYVCLCTEQENAADKRTPTKKRKQREERNKQC